MLNSAFCSTNATLQSGAAAVTEEIIRMRSLSPDAFIVGSWADGWGSCFTRLNGDIGTDSDIDATDVLTRELFHLPGVNSCNRERCVEHKYVDGHIQYDLNVTQPTFHHRGSSIKPAIDYVPAYPCCNYPEIEILIPSHKTNIRSSIITDLRSMLSSTQCHVVSAAPSGYEGRRMRVSTTLLERKLMQSLNTLQGQCFVIIKYLIKIIVNNQMRVKGLKTYHAKNLMFYMLDVTPEERWNEPENLIELVKQAMRNLYKDLTDPNSSEHQCMRHFFLRDATVYLHDGHDSKQKIANAVQLVIDQLPQLLYQYQQKLIPTKTGLIRLHPFAVYPDVWYNYRRDYLGVVEYHEIDKLIEYLIVQLSTEPTSDSQEEGADQLMKHIDRIPDSARTARESLRAMAYLRSGNRDGASRGLIRALRGGFRVSRGIQSDVSITEFTVNHAKMTVWKQLKDSDSVWKICFRCVTRPELNVLPDHLRKIFPSLASIYNYTRIYYINFDALMKALQLECLRGRVSADKLFDDAINGDADPQELYMMMHYVNDEEMLAKAIYGNGDVIKDSGMGDDVIKFIHSRPTLHEKCIRATAELMMRQIN